MRKVVVSAAIVIVASVVVLAWPKPRPKAKDSRATTARLTGEEYAPRRVMRGSSGSREDEIDALIETVSSDPQVRGRALLRTRETAEAIPELRNAAKSGDPTALADLAAGLVEQASYHGEKAAALEAVSVARRALDKEPDLAAAHFNLALALERLGLSDEARAAFQWAAEVDVNSQWAAEARDRAQRLRNDELQIDTDRIARYVDLTADRTAHEILRPYFRERERELQHARAPVDGAARLARAAYAYTYGGEYLAGSVARALQTLCSGREPCATRYYTAGALAAAGRRREALTWLGSVDSDVLRSTGKGGFAAQLAWEQGLNLVIGRKSEEALHLFEAQYVSSVAAREQEAAALFDWLARVVRGDLVEAEFSRADMPAAFRIADGGSVLDDVRTALAPEAAILRYTVVKNELVVFLIRRESFEVVPLRSALADVAQAVGTMRDADDRQFASAASSLHDLVFAPLREKLEGVSTIAVVPSPELAGIPFGALLDITRGEHLVERFTIVQATSARAAIESSEHALDARDPTVLAIGATEFNPRADPLPGANREISDIAAASPCVRVYAGAEATPDAVQRAFADNAIIHYAGHIVRRGADVRLLLAASKGRDGLSSSEIAAFRLHKPRVVVLAACRGAANRDPSPIAPTMAEAFLAAGVPTVIASSYDVDDAEAPATMRRLHTLLRDGGDAAEALRETTIEELKSGRGVPLSIRFHAIGGSRSLVR